jgi:hypothetical protein
LSANTIQGRIRAHIIKFKDPVSQICQILHNFQKDLGSCSVIIRRKISLS